MVHDLLGLIVIWFLLTKEATTFWSLIFEFFADSFEWLLGHICLVDKLDLE